MILAGGFLVGKPLDREGHAEQFYEGGDHGHAHLDRLLAVPVTPPSEPEPTPVQPPPVSPVVEVEAVPQDPVPEQPESGQSQS